MDWRKNKINKLMLGTAQLGSKYGISNKHGIPPAAEAAEILNLAFSLGITAFDTAPAYQESEQIIGKFINSVSEKDHIHIFTKIGSKEFTTKREFFDGIKSSLEKLQISTIFGLLIHSPKMISQWKPVYSEWIGEAKQKNFIQHVGISVYTEYEASAAIDHPDLDIIQMPFNIFDQRAITRGLIDQAISKNKLLVFRSIFLQGLLCLNLHNLPQNMLFAKPYLAEYLGICRESHIDPRFGAFKFAQYFSGVYPIIVGLETKSQLETNCRYLKQNGIPEEFFNKLQFAFSDINNEKLIDPSCWP